MIVSFGYQREPLLSLISVLIENIHFKYPFPVQLDISIPHRLTSVMFNSLH